MGYDKNFDPRCGAFMKEIINEGIRPTIFPKGGGNVHIPFVQILPLCPHGGRWGKTLISA